jgi:hypothetical protein
VATESSELFELQCIDPTYDGVDSRYPMFCPNCALEDRSQSQYCRSCGTELHVVRTTLERTDAIANSAVTAREEIGHAIAAKIKEMRSVRDLRRVAEDVLPQVEKFLETPEERRMRNLRGGVITAAVGLGAVLSFLLLASLLRDTEMILSLMGAGASSVIFLVGLGIVINARWFTVLPRGTSQTVGNVKHQLLTDAISTGSLHPEPPAQTPSNIASVTEGTTRELR